jgi:endo-1,4-beta-xylanase
MRFTSPTFLTKRSFRLAVLTIFIFSSILGSCSSSLEDELAPATPKENSSVDLKDQGQGTGSDADQGAGGGTGQGAEEGATGSEGGDGGAEEGKPGSDEAGQGADGTTDSGKEPAGSPTPGQQQTPGAPAPTPAAEQPKPATIVPLKSAFDFPVGAAVVKELLEKPEYANTVSKHFSRIGSESDFKWGNVHPSKDKYTFAKADAVVAFAQKYNMKVHAHTLLWAHDGNEPKWVKEFQGDEAAWEQLMKDHIYTVVKHFKGKVQSWDVVNEPIKEGGVYTNSIWYRKLGKNYIIKAFKFAQEADPQAKLFLNDYGQEYGGKKMKELLNIVDEAKKQGVTIHGMGFQLHTVLRMEAKPILTNLKLAADKGLLIHISEFDISVRYGMPDKFALTDAMDKAQGAKYKEIVSGYMKVVPKSQQWGITTWGVSDKTSYFNKGYANSDHDYPLLFDRNYQPKEAFFGFLNAGLGK